MQDPVATPDGVPDLPTIGQLGREQIKNLQMLQKEGLQSPNQAPPTLNANEDQ